MFVVGVVKSVARDFDQAPPRVLAQNAVYPLPFPTLPPDGGLVPVSARLGVRRDEAGIGGLLDSRHGASSERDGYGNFSFSVATDVASVPGESAQFTQLSGVGFHSRNRGEQR